MCYWKTEGYAGVSGCFWTSEHTLQVGPGAFSSLLISTGAGLIQPMVTPVTAQSGLDGNESMMNTLKR